MELKIKVEEGFSLENAVCNHGFFMMSPNLWISSTKSLRRPLRLADRCTSVTVSISQPKLDSHLLVDVENLDSLSAFDQEVIQEQIVRMLRITTKDGDDVKKFQDMHAQAKSEGFGRLFRSPGLFEDIVKTILLLNTSWNRTLQMSRALCELQAELNPGNQKDAFIPQDGQPSKIKSTIPDFFRKRKRETESTVRPSETQKATGPVAPTSHSETQKAPSAVASSQIIRCKPLGNFPNSKELAGLTEELLQNRCHVGYRAKYIIEMANKVEDGSLRLEEFEEHKARSKTASKQIHRKLMKLNGIGQFGASNILMCLGEYRHIPIDSETIKHLREAHGRKNCKNTTVERIAGEVYDKFAPYQCLAYWYEHVELYEKQLGKKLSQLSPSRYHKVSSNYLSCNTPEKKKNI